MPSWSACRVTILAVIPRTPLPLFVTVTVLAGLVPRTRMDPKARLDADKDTPAAALEGVPAPPRSTIRCDPICSWALSPEVVWGVNVTFNVQLAFGSSGAGQPSARKSPEFGLEMIDTPIGTCSDVMFVTVTVLESDWP